MYIWFMIIYRCVYKVIVVISWYFGCFEKKRGWVFFYYKFDWKYRYSNNYVLRNSVFCNFNFIIKNYIV